MGLIFLTNLLMQTHSLSQPQSLAVSEFFAGVYKWMAAAMILTTFVAWQTANSAAVMQYLATHQSLIFVLFLAQISLVIALSGWAHRLSQGAAVALFLGYAALTGFTFSGLILAYTAVSIAKAFGVTVAMFGAMSAYGYATQRDLSGWGSFLFMSVIGLVLGSLLNLWLASPMVEWMVTYGGVVIFAGLAAYDHQQLKQFALMDPDGSQNLAVRGALMLYLDFINLFLSLLRIFGDRR